jgi:FkbM family methyltransferase
MFNMTQYDINCRYHGSEYSQDLFALISTNFKKNGFFVEIGACDGRCSNTFRLEKYFNWSGILIEPHPENFKNLKNSTVERNAILVNKAVSNRVGIGKIMGHGGTATLLNRYAESNTKETYKISIDTLDNILKENNAPKKIEYISIDAEGSELKILSSFSFNYDVDSFSIEIKGIHEKEIDKIMEKNNYIKILEPFSYIDSWYVKTNIYHRLFEDSKS